MGTCSGQQTVHVSVCRLSWTGHVSCQPAITGAVADGEPLDLSLPVTPAADDADTLWDYYYIGAWSNCLRLQIIGAGWGQ